MKYCMGCMEQYEDNYDVCPYCGYIENSPPVNSLQMVPGSILADRYIVGRSIGSGGFGVTYIGWDAVLETKVAIKEYLPSEFATRAYGSTDVTVFSGDKQEQFESGMKRFVDEAKRLAKFSSSKGIVNIFDSFEFNNTSYIIMELLEGETLAQLLEREKTIPPDKAVEMLMPVMKSLSEVHAAGIIHRDIAPDNIYITKSGDIKLIDFGAARFATPTHSRSLTVLVKEGYSPEEQYESKGEQGPHTDVYAIAATLYRMITGVEPPESMRRKANIRNHKKDPLLPLDKFVNDIDENVETAILNALNVQISDRTENMDKFMAELTSETRVKRRAAHISGFMRLKWPRWAKIAVPATGAALAAFGILFATGVIGFDANMKKEITIPGGQTRVPSVINMEYPEAKQMIEDAGLIVKIGGKEHDDNIPANRVLKQSIFDGSVVAKNTVVQVEISAGNAPMPMINVLGLDAKKAQSELEELGLKVSLEETADDVIAEGHVVSQSTVADDDVYDDDEITLIVSNGRTEARGDPTAENAEDFVGLTYEKAIALADKNDMLLAVSEYRYSKTYEKGTVIEHTPAAGSELDEDKCVTLVVSMGYGTVNVPDVMYLDETKACAELRAVGLIPEVTYEYSNDAEGLVIAQSPEGDAEAETESIVKLIVSMGAESVDMPDLIGMDKDEATEKAHELGLVVEYSYKNDSSKKENTVLAQDPEKDSKVRSGDEITLVICTHDDTIDVPDVVNMDRSNAEKTLSDKGLNVNVVEVVDDSHIGLVISQSPKGGSQITKGGTVTITVGKQTETVYNEPEEKNDTNDDKEESKEPEKRTFRITFDYNYSGAKNDVKEYEEGQSIDCPADPKRQGYKFIGWSTSPDRKVILNNLRAKDNLTFYAIWEPEPTKITIERPEYDLYEGDTGYFNYITEYDNNVSPEDADNYRPDVTWSSDNENIITIDKDGYYNAISAGTVTITVKLSNGLSSSIDIEVLSVKNETETADISIESAQNSITRGGVLEFDVYVSATTKIDCMQISFDLSGVNTEDYSVNMEIDTDSLSDAGFDENAFKGYMTSDEIEDFPDLKPYTFIAYDTDFVDSYTPGDRVHIGRLSVIPDESSSEITVTLNDECIVQYNVDEQFSISYNYVSVPVFD